MRKTLLMLMLIASLCILSGCQVVACIVQNKVDAGIFDEKVQEAKDNFPAVREELEKDISIFLPALIKEQNRPKDLTGIGLSKNEETIQKWIERYGEDVGGALQRLNQYESFWWDENHNTFYVELYFHRPKTVQYLYAPDVDVTLQHGPLGMKSTGGIEDLGDGWYLYVD